MRFLLAASCFFLSLTSWANPRIKQPLIARDDSFLAAESSLAAVLSLQTAAIVTTQAVSEATRVDKRASEESSIKPAVLVISDWSLGCWEHGWLNVVEFFYHGSQVIAIGLQHPSGDVTWTHAIGRGPLGPCFLKDLTGQGNDYFIFTDHLGTPFAWHDPDTGQTTYTPFNPWGELLATPTSGYSPYEHGNVPTSGFNLPTFEVFDVTPLGLAGHIYDEKTGLVYMHHRYLHPRLGHFLTPDFRAPDIYDPSTFTEPYAYAAGNPVMYWDPDGLDEEAFLKGALKESAKEIPIPIVNSLNGKLILFIETEGNLLDKTKAVLVQPVVDLKNTYQAIQETRENHGTAMAVNRFINPAWNIYEGWDRVQNVIQIMSTVPPEFWTEELGVEFVGSANQTAQGVGGTALVAYGGGKVFLATPATIRAVMRSFKYRGIDMAALDAHIMADLAQVSGRNTLLLAETPSSAAMADFVVSLEGANLAGVLAPTAEMGAAHNAAIYQRFRIDLARLEIVSPADSMSGPVVTRLPVAGATDAQIAQIRRYTAIADLCVREGYMSPTGRVSTSGALRRVASRAARMEGRRALAEGNPYQGVVGHGPDTTWTALPEAPFWMDLDFSINSSLGRQSLDYPLGFRPTMFIFEGDL